jgi:hypothetical protein
MILTEVKLILELTIAKNEFSVTKFTVIPGWMNSVTTSVDSEQKDQNIDLR